MVDIWLALMDVIYDDPLIEPLFLASTIGLEVKLCENQKLFDALVGYSYSAILVSIKVCTYTLGIQGLLHVHVQLKFIT